MTSTQRRALALAIQNSLRAGRKVTLAGVRNALLFQGVPEAQADQEAADLLDTAWDAIATVLLLLDSFDKGDGGEPGSQPTLHLVKRSEARP